MSVYEIGADRLRETEFWKSVEAAASAAGIEVALAVPDLLSEAMAGPCVRNAAMARFIRSEPAGEDVGVVIMVTEEMFFDAASGAPLVDSALRQMAAFLAENPDPEEWHRKQLEEMAAEEEE